MTEPAPQRYAAGYGAAAEAYHAVLDPTLAPVHRRLADLAGAKRGRRLLDLATGTGAAAREAATRGAAVVGVDISPGMIHLARRNSPGQIRFEIADASNLPFEAGSFDRVICGFGLSHMPDPVEVLREARRVLRGGGALVESSWGAEGDNDAFSTVLSILKRRSKVGLHSFSGILDEDTWSDGDRGCQVIESAGFAEVRVVTERLQGSFPSPNAALNWTLAWPDYGEIADLLGDERSDFVLETLEALTPKRLDWWFSINYYVAMCPD